MKRGILVFINVSVMLASVFSNVAFAEVDGFRGIKWGTTLSSLDNTLNYVATDPELGGIKKFTKKDDKLKIGEADLERIEYTFWNDTFCGVRIYVKGQKNFNALKNATFEEFGKGKQILPNTENYIWTEKETTIMLKNKEALTGEPNILSITSKSIIDEAIRIDKKNSKAKRGF